MNEIIQLVKWNEPIHTHNVKYFINEKELNKIIEENTNEYKKLNPNTKYFNELTITCIQTNLKKKTQ